MLILQSAGSERTYPPLRGYAGRFDDPAPMAPRKPLSSR